MITKNDLQNGDILICSSNGILGKLIKKFTKSNINHIAMVIKVDDILMVIDSQKDGTNPKTYENWIKKYNYDFYGFRYCYNSKKMEQKNKRKSTF